MHICSYVQCRGFKFISYLFLDKLAALRFSAYKASSIANARRALVFRFHDLIGQFTSSIESREIMAPIRFMRVSTYVCSMYLSINTVCNIGALSICRSTKKVSLIQKVKIDLGDFQRFLNNVSRHSFTFSYYHFMCGLCSCVKIFVSIFYPVLRCSKFFPTMVIILYFALHELTNFLSLFSVLKIFVLYTKIFSLCGPWER